MTTQTKKNRIVKAHECQAYTQHAGATERIMTC